MEVSKQLLELTSVEGSNSMNNVLALYGTTVWCDSTAAH